LRRRKISKELSSVEDYHTSNRRLNAGRNAHINKQSSWSSSKLRIVNSNSKQSSTNYLPSSVVFSGPSSSVISARLERSRSRRSSSTITPTPASTERAGMKYMRDGNKEILIEDESSARKNET
jgi:hypothetical protein